MDVGSSPDLWSQQITTSDAWEVLTRHLEFHQGFAFALLLTPGAALANTFRQLLENHLEPESKRVLDCSPRSPTELIELAGTLTSLHPPVDIAAVWVAVPDAVTGADEENWAAAIRRAFAQLNTVRNLLQRQIRCTLVIAGHRSLQPIIRTMAPDLWSVRAFIKELAIAPPRSDAGIELHRSQTSSSNVEAPDPELALSMVERMRGRKGQELALSAALYRAGLGFLERGEAVRARDLLMEAETLSESFSTSPADHGNVELALARACANIDGHEDEARDRFKSAIADFRACTDPTLLANGLKAFGEYETSEQRPGIAQSFLREAAALFETEGNELGLADTLASLGVAAWRDGDFQAARSAEEQVLRIRHRTLGEDHPSMLDAMNNLAVTLRAGGDPTEARRLQEQVLEGRRRTLGEDHPDTITAMNNLANTLRSVGDLLEARKLQEQVLNGSRRILGTNHPDTLTAMSNLAVTLRNAGQATESHKLREEVLEGRRRILGANHPDTLSAMNNLAITLGSFGGAVESRKLQEQVLEGRRLVLGENHPDTFRAMGNLAITVQDAGDFVVSRKLQEQVLQGLIRILGENHPDTLLAKDNLAFTVRRMQEMAQSNGQPQEHV